ncbi:cadherin-like protein 26 isoform X1 [Carassius gibelio]|uniref:cadherin-like protein 26 isoform X1 n=1 Tax=Carassius gibelio TaxID=101364 RepID=UPI0022799342|nr:cadherin-like protein 26 isoform X1 [Carassius gibelio]
MICFSMRILTVSFLLLLSVWSVCVCADSGRIRQKRAWIIDSFSIEEEHPGPFPFSIGKAAVEKTFLVNYVLHGQGVDEDPKDLLSIDTSGVFYVHRKVDYESGPKVLHLTFEAIDALNKKVDTRLSVEIKILDVNDHAPKFQKPVYEVTVDESHDQGKEVLTVLAFDEDDSSTDNGTFDFTIKSVTPLTDNVEFYIQQRKESGTIYFKGCLDYEKAQKYTILIEAKDRGEKKQLSSTSTLIINISDNNNNLPEFSGKTGPGKVKEGEAGVEVLRLQVTDKDVRGSKAWKAKYTISEDKKEIFKIETDPVTNEGILTVVKQTDYEEQTNHNLSISVQNEIPYFSCKIKNKVQNATWVLNKIPPISGTSAAKFYNSIPVTIYVEDVNDPPVFTPNVKYVTVAENIDAGTSLATFTAKDMDGSHMNTFTFVKGEDINKWITVNAKTGEVSTIQVLDRESPFVINSTYTATLYAVDDGVPPLTGTGTLVIQLIDENDNLPILERNKVSICIDKEPTLVNITATDLDFPPYGSPFYYELLGDVKDKWRVEPAQGTTVSLVKEKGVYSGHHFLQMKISDQQGLSSIQNLTVTVCDCSISPNCHLRTISQARVGPGAAWMVVLAILIFTVMCLISLLISCKTEKRMIMIDDGHGHLITSNTENPGTDCVVSSSMGFHKTVPSNANLVNVTKNVGSSQKVTTQTVSSSMGFHKTVPSNVNFVNVTKNVGSSQKVTTQTNLQVMQTGQQAVSQTSLSVHNNQMLKGTVYRNSTRRTYRGFSRQSNVTSSFRSSTSYNTKASYLSENLGVLINQKLLALQTRDEGHSIYKPHCYADEGQPAASDELDAISIPEDHFHPEMLKNLDSKFSQLAKISRPDLMRR